MNGRSQTQTTSDQKQHVERDFFERFLIEDGRTPHAIERQKKQGYSPRHRNRSIRQPRNPGLQKPSREPQTRRRKKNHHYTEFAYTHWPKAPRLDSQQISCIFNCISLNAKCQLRENQPSKP